MARKKEPKPAAAPVPAAGRHRASALVDTRVIYCGDNLEQLRKLPDHCVDLIYIDPPFNSNRNYEVFWGETKEKRAFEDRHASTAAYIDFMRPRCVELSRVLKPTGSFYYHCDWHASHYVKVMLDQIFGQNTFQNEIVWRRHYSHNDPKKYGCVHDVIFYYVGGAVLTWNQQFVPHSESYVKSHYSSVDKHERHYQLVSCSAPGDGPPRGFGEHGELKPPSGRHWSWTQEGIDELLAKGRIVFTKTGMPRLIQYLDEMKGVPLQDCWDDIPPVNSQATESLGYPTQKPLPLLERIIRASSNENDIVLDAFCGCGTALVAAQNLGRQWIGIDISPTACRVMAKRLRDVCSLPEDVALWKAGRGFVVRDLPWSEEKLRALPPFEFENWAVIALGGIPNKTQVGDRGIDGRIYPVSAAPERRGKAKAEFEFTDVWYPIQVKQKDKVGRPD
ncbi:MAG: site-specific DNA-methyltransferase, partial [Planctomycetes bacterium]|nr:site-specific DNA-methyltransferase [Planctomycetota bacterium]